MAFHTRQPSGPEVPVPAATAQARVWARSACVRPQRTGHSYLHDAIRPKDARRAGHPRRPPTRPPAETCRGACWWHGGFPPVTQHPPGRCPGPAPLGPGARLADCLSACARGLPSGRFFNPFARVPWACLLEELGGGWGEADHLCLCLPPTGDTDCEAAGRRPTPGAGEDEHRQQWAHSFWRAFNLRASGRAALFCFLFTHRAVSLSLLEGGRPHPGLFLCFP